MKRQVELTDEQIKELTGFYQNKIDDLKDKIKEYQDIINSLSASKDRPKTKMKRTKFSNTKGYTWKGRSKEILMDNDFPMTTNEIYEEMLRRDPNLKERKRRSLISSISGSLSQADNIKSFEDPNGTGNLWALPNMLNADGYPKDRYVDRLNEIKGYNMKYASEKDSLWN